jgi:hypothetical protein
MDFTTATAIAAGSGCLAGATEDVARRLVQAFGDREPTAQAINQHVQALKEQADHLWPKAPAQSSPVPAGMVPEVWAKMSPESRLGWWYTHHPREPVERRPRTMQLSAEHIAALARMHPTARSTAYRELQAQQQKG